jgi:hypothetical protein
VAATQAVQDLTRQERPAAALTLTRTATLAVVTTGTTITWQTQTRGIGITWSGTDITIPTAGYYVINFSYASSTTHTALARLSVNGTITGLFASSYATQVVATGTHTFTHMRYFATGATVQVIVLPSANVTINVNAESASNESPILHIVQLTSVVT